MEQRGVKDRAGADRTAPVCMRSYSSASSNAAGRKERKRMRMIGFSRMAYEVLKEEPSGRIPASPKIMWKKSKPATIWLFLCFTAQIPLKLLKYIVMGICFIPHAIYEALD